MKFETKLGGIKNIVNCPQERLQIKLIGRTNQKKYVKAI